MKTSNSKSFFFPNFKMKTLKSQNFVKFILYIYIYTYISTFQRSMFLEVLKMFKLVLFEHRHRNKVNFLTPFKWFNLKLNFIGFKIHQIWTFKMHSQLPILVHFSVLSQLKIYTIHWSPYCYLHNKKLKTIDM